MKLHRCVLLFLLLAQCSCAQVPEDHEKLLVLTSLAPIYQLAAPLLANTDVELRLLPASARSMQTHETLFIRRIEDFAGDFSQATAVITIGSVWKADPLYVSARQYNIRVVNIDAGKPYSHELDGVGIAQSPVDGAVSPYFWLSPSNIIRMITIMGSDLETLFPQHAQTIAANLDMELAFYRNLKAATEQRLLVVDDPVLYALSDAFIYLTRDLNLFVDGYFVKQDIDWSEGDYANLGMALTGHDVGVVIHLWEPAEPIQAAIRTAGARLVVLDTLETTDNFAAGLQHNLDLLAEAFGAP